MAASIPDKSFALIIVAAGKGERFQSVRPKQYQLLSAPYSILECTIQAFLPLWDFFTGHWLVIQPDHKAYWNPLIESGQYPGLKVIPGGAERYQSVFNALEKCRNTVEYVLIHDAVRPLASSDLIRKIMYKTIEYGACIPALPVRDTIKEIDTSGMVKSTLNRESLRMIQTPQGFHLETLCQAMESYRDCACSDEAAYLEMAGKPVKTIRGEYTNLKVTYPEDMEWARYYVEKRFE